MTKFFSTQELSVLVALKTETLLRDFSLLKDFQSYPLRFNIPLIISIQF